MRYAENNVHVHFQVPAQLTWMCSEKKRNFGNSHVIRSISHNTFLFVFVKNNKSNMSWSFILIINVET